MKALHIIMSILVLVIIGAVSVSIISSEPPEPNETPWQYDDYRVVEGVTGAQGSLELVSVGGVQYLHASKLGAGSYDTADGTVKVHVSKAKLDLILMLGQSNATYVQADPSQADPIPPPGTSYMYMAEDGDYKVSAEGREFRSMVKADGGSATGDKAPAFASAYHAASGCKVYLVCGAVGGVPVLSYDPATGSSWRAAERTLKAALDAVDHSKFSVSSKYYTWIQGESNKYTEPDTYIKQFMRMHDAILDGDLGRTFSHCFVSLPTDYHGGNSVQALETIASRTSTVSIVTDVANTFTVENGLMDPDGIHYSQLGDNIIGVELGKAAGEYRTSRTTDISGFLPVIGTMVGLAAAVGCLWLLLPYIRGRD